MTQDKLEQLRLEDIEFFAKRYVELFAKHFDIITPEQKQQFYVQIKEDLYKNAPIYVVDNNSLSPHASAQSTYDKIILSDYNVNNKKIRIHELVHSYNQIKYQLHGLRDIENNFVLINLDEGTTELIAQLMLGNENLKDTEYSEEVRLANFITNLVGESIMIQATRGKPQLLSEEVDKLLGTKDFLRYLEAQQSEYNKLVTESFGQDVFWGTDISQERQILSKLKIESLRGKDSLSLLYDAIKKTENQDLITKFNQIDNKYGYDFVFRKMISKDTSLGPDEPTLADIQQEQIKKELNQLSNSNQTPYDELKIELIKFLYDKIDFQRYFVGKNNYTYGTYDLTSEDIIYCYKFKSSIDGQNIRLGGKFGIEGISNKVTELDNTPYLIGRKHIDSMYIEGVGFDELLDCRLEIMAEKLTITQLKEVLKEWSVWIKNTFLAERFPNEFPETFDLVIERLKYELDEREKNLISKYKKNTTQVFDNNVPEFQHNIENEEAVRQSAERSVRYNFGTSPEELVINGGVLSENASESHLTGSQKTAEELEFERTQLLARLKEKVMKKEISLAEASKLIHEINIAYGVDDEIVQENTQGGKRK
jgi:uncharacterized Rmd1/YagE family protein